MTRALPAAEITGRLRAIAQPTRLAAADLIDQLERENAELHEAVKQADAGFEAALAEGWLDAMAAGDPARIAEIWQRHLSPARHTIALAVAATATDTQRDMHHG